MSHVRSHLSNSTSNRAPQHKQESTIKRISDHSSHHDALSANTSPSMETEEVSLRVTVKPGSSPRRRSCDQAGDLGKIAPRRRSDPLVSSRWEILKEDTHHSAVLPPDLKSPLCNRWAQESYVGAITKCCNDITGDVSLRSPGRRTVKELSPQKPTRKATLIPSSIKKKVPSMITVPPRQPKRNNSLDCIPTLPKRQVSGRKLTPSSDHSTSHSSI